MSTEANNGSSNLTPDQAFSVLGNEIRMEILQTLGEADTALSFSDIREQVAVDDPGQVNYHLNQLKGHFVRKADAGYGLLEPGHRIIQAVLSGGVTGTSELEPTDLDAPCPYCDEPVEISYREERLLIRCSDCPGTFAGSETDAPFLDAHPYGTVGVLPLPPAGIAERTPRGVLDATIVWTITEFLALASGVCPRCSVAIDWSLSVCEDHDASEGNCDSCNTRHAVNVDYDCPNCTHEEAIVPAGFNLFLSVPELMSFFSPRGIIPAMPSWETTAPMFDYKDEVLESDPLEVRLTYTIDGDRLILTVDDDLTVIDATVIAGLPE